MGTEKRDDHARVNEDERVCYNDQRRTGRLASRTPFTLFLDPCQVVA